MVKRAYSSIMWTRLRFQYSLDSWSFLPPSCSLWECTGTFAHAHTCAYIHITNHSRIHPLSHPPTENVPQGARSSVPRADAEETGLWKLLRHALGKRSGPRLLQLPVIVPHRLHTFQCHLSQGLSLPEMRSCWCASHQSPKQQAPATFHSYSPQPQALW